MSVILTTGALATGGHGFWLPDSFAAAKPVPVSEIAQRSYSRGELFSLTLPDFLWYF
jgi:hypothetical protein